MKHKTNFQVAQKWICKKIKKKIGVLFGWKPELEVVNKRK
jgi:hypothetical protein